MKRVLPIVAMLSSLLRSATVGIGMRATPSRGGLPKVALLWLLIVELAVDTWSKNVAAGVGEPLIRMRSLECTGPRIWSPPPKTMVLPLVSVSKSVK